MATDVIVLFALEREAGPFRLAARGLPVTIGVTGVGQAAARRAAEHLLTRPHPPLLVMAGFCGALCPDLIIGDVVIPGRVVDQSGGAWGCVHAGGETLLSVPRLVAAPADKHALHAQHRAAIVDMESAAVAAVCAERDVPFQAVRAISDAADTTLSPRLVRLLSGGSVSPMKAVAALARQPSLIGEFRRLARDTRLAARHLAEVLVSLVKHERPRAAVPGRS